MKVFLPSCSCTDAVYDDSGAEGHIRELENQMHFLGREVKHLTQLRHLDCQQLLQQRRSTAQYCYLPLALKSSEKNVMRIISKLLNSKVAFKRTDMRVLNFRR